MNLKTIKLIVGASLLALPSLIQAQNVPIVAAHYPAGAEGIKGASLPPPGIYARDYNFFYQADHFRDGPAPFNLLAYVNAPRLIWMTEFKVLGANYGMDVIVPFGYMDYKYKPAPPVTIKETYFGVGDIQVEPLLLSWHFTQFDVSAGYAFWAPTGDFKPSRPGVLAQGFWSHMLTLGGTWYPDEAKTWAVSLLNRYEFCHEQQDTDVNPGQVYTIEWGLSKSVAKTIDVGFIGYYQQQTTEDNGSHSFSDALDRKVGFGPEISMFCPKCGLFASLRYAYEVAARERPEGNLVTLTLTKRF